MVVARVVEEAHDTGELSSIAYNMQRKEIYSSADGDKVIKVGLTSWECSCWSLVCAASGSTAP
jgi:hypothetical protein